MAVMELEEPKKRKRRTQNPRKLLVNAKVEVRSVENGFQGSWHPGIVIACDQQGHRQVEYNHLQCDDESGKLVDVVPISPILDGIGSFTGNMSNYRGCIRPTPPRIQPGEWDLPYGLCVDVYHEEGWWEGVIFDHKDGSEERRIFFPDLGDELNARIDTTIRITHDWDEVTEKWKQRRTWILLELLEKYDNERYIAVSVKQIWYDVQEKKGFENVKEWTSPMRHLWEELVLEVIDDNISITVDELFGVLDKSGCLSLETHVELESAHFSSDANINPKENMVDSSPIIPVHNQLCSDPLVDREDTFKNAINCVPNCCVGFINEQDVDGGLSINPDSACVQQVQEKSYMDKLISVSGDELPDKGVSVLPQVLSAFPSNLDGNSCVNSGIRNGGIRSFKSRSKSTLNWLPLDFQAVYCPVAVEEYSDKRSNFIGTAVRQHLQYLGWKMEFAIDKGKYRQRYLSPGRGEYEYSLFQVCKKLKKPKRDTNISISEKATQGMHCSEEQPFLIEQPRESQHPSYCPQRSGSSYHKEFIYKPEYCHEAVVEYYNHAVAKIKKKKVRKMRSKAKKHLSAVGWVFLYVSIKTRNLCYKSPKGVVHLTLQSACKSCMDGDFAERPAECMYVIEEDQGQSTRNRIWSAARNLGNHEGLVLSKTLTKKCSRDTVSMSQASNLVEIGNVKVHGSRKRRKKRKYGSTEELIIGDEKLRFLKDQCANPPKLKRRKGSGDLNGSRDELGGSQPTRVLRSSKQVQEATSSHNNPRTVLTWLIDNNMVSPREKVNYRSTKDSHPMKEGKITRKGIRCSCCKEVYTLSSFGHHAGSSNHRPYANIFLEDGRSLLDCQVQIMHGRREQNFRKQPCDRMKGNWCRGENDYICTVCHFGGDLILCDQCPSSFHKKCLGLKAVPEGDWFCSSCRCGICGHMNFKEEKESIMDDSCVLTCGQCEHKYHKGCLRKRVTNENESDPKGNWFCSKNCKKIFFSLDERLGKQIPVGDDNLSWSLLKLNKCDTHATDEHDIDDALMDSRLNIALDVVHECFLPVKEPLTGRDLAEDVIFSRRSHLNRLNFQGFYTVLLERNDELITVATVRIFGDKVAEVPLVATRFHYRRLGMCRILMDELEKLLMELGVERLVLPAVPSVLNTWTTSFGFSKMTPSERLKFLDYTFLDFQGTIMCQKLLMKNAPAEARPLKRTRLDLYGDICGSRDNADFDSSSYDTELYQEEQTEDGRIIYQGVNNAAGNESRPRVGESSREFSCFEDANCEKISHQHYKQYKRRRISAKRIQVMLRRLTLHD